MIGPSLDDDLPRLQARLALLQYQGRIALQQTDDVQRLGLVHRGMAGLVDQVVCPAEFGETFQGRFYRGSPWEFPRAAGLRRTTALRHCPWPDPVSASGSRGPHVRGD